MDYIKAMYAFIMAEFTKAHEVFVEQTLMQNVITIVLLYLFGAALPFIAIYVLALRIRNRFVK